MWLSECERIFVFFLCSFFWLFLLFYHINRDQAHSCLGIFLPFSIQAAALPTRTMKFDHRYTIKSCMSTIRRDQYWTASKTLLTDTPSKMLTFLLTPVSSPLRTALAKMPCFLRRRFPDLRQQTGRALAALSQSTVPWDALILLLASMIIIDLQHLDLKSSWVNYQPQMPQSARVQHVVAKVLKLQISRAVSNCLVTVSRKERLLSL